MLYIALKEGRLADYIIYEVSTDVLFLRDTLFTHCNAAKNGVKFSDDINYMLQIPFDFSIIDRTIKTQCIRITLCLKC